MPKGQKEEWSLNEICAAYATAISADTCQKWFARFCSGDLNLNDA